VKTIFNDNLVFEHPQPAASAEDNRYFPAFVEDVTRKRKLNNSLIVDKMNYGSICRDELMRDLVKHIKGNIVQLSSQKYLQSCGKSLSMLWIIRECWTLDSNPLGLLM
jgi:hypothetical protein